LIGGHDYPSTWSAIVIVSMVVYVALYAVGDMLCIRGNAYERDRSASGIYPGCKASCLGLKLEEYVVSTLTVLWNGIDLYC